MSEPYMFMDDLFDWNDWMTFGQPEPDWAAGNLGGAARFAPGSSLHMNDQVLINEWDIATSEPGDASEPRNPNSSSPPFPKAIYLRTTCASCDAPLDTSEQDSDLRQPSIFCTLNQESEHLPLICETPDCDKRFRDLVDLKEHCATSGHSSLNCGISTCQQPLRGDTWNLKKHFLEHQEIKYRCNVCSVGYDILHQLDSHCRVTEHAGYKCYSPGCESEFLQIRDLQKHELTHKKIAPRFPCTHCRTYRGRNGFKRKDHLRQHIRNYHRIEDYEVNLKCQHCWAFFDTLEVLTYHRIQAHQMSAYICLERKCERVGMNGFANKDELKLHIKEDHLPPFQCSFPGCDRVGEKGWKRKRDMVKHIEKKHGKTVGGENAL